MSQLKELQERRFHEVIQEVLGDQCTIKTSVDENGILEEAKIQTKKELDDGDLNRLIFYAGSWACRLHVKRSGSGIRIKFTIAPDKLSLVQKEQYTRSINVKRPQTLEGARGH